MRSDPDPSSDLPEWLQAPAMEEQAEAEHNRWLAQQEATNERLTMLIWATLFFAVAIFLKVPGLDLLASAQYWRPDTGFFMGQHPVILWVYKWGPWIGRVLLLGLALFALQAPRIAQWWRRAGQPDRANRCEHTWRRWAALAALAAALGNGVVIEGMLKHTVGRPRPVQVDVFGGPEHYVPPFQIGHDPAQHKSFTSGHAAVGFSLMCLGVGCGPLWRRRWLLLGIVGGALMGYMRILQGGHYASDVLFSFYVMWLSCEVVRWFDRRRQARQAPDT